MLTGTVAPSVVPVISLTTGGWATGGVLSSRTLRRTVPETPPTVAVIVAVPGVDARNRPAESKVPVTPETDHWTALAEIGTGLYAASWPKRLKSIVRVVKVVWLPGVTVIDASGPVGAALNTTRLFATERSAPSDGRLTIDTVPSPGSRTAIAVDPPPSRLIASTAPCSRSSAASSESVTPVL